MIRIEEELVVNNKTIDARILSRMFLAGAKNLEAKKEWINELNVFPVPDGDTGTNMTMTIMSAAREVGALSNPTMKELAKARKMRGVSTLKKGDLIDAMLELDEQEEQKEAAEEAREESLLKIAFESFEKYPDISQNILDRFQNSLEVPNDILDLQVLIAVKKSKDDFINIPKYIEEIDDLDFIKAKIILQIVDFYKDDIDKVIDFVFVSIDKFYSDAIKYETIYNIQKVTNKNYSQKLKELSKNINLDDDSISFDNKIWFEFLVNRLEI